VFVLRPLCWGDPPDRTRFADSMSDLPPLVSRPDDLSSSLCLHSFVFLTRAHFSSPHFSCQATHIAASSTKTTILLALTSTWVSRLCLTDHSACSPRLNLWSSILSRSPFLLLPLSPPTCQTFQTSLRRHSPPSLCPKLNLDSTYSLLPLLSPTLSPSLLGSMEIPHRVEHTPVDTLHPAV
jgi:hypothetical protein